MGKRVILTLMEGSFEQGFPAILRISSDGANAEAAIQIAGKLPSAPNILEAFKNWQLAYRQLVMPHCRIKAKRAQVTNISCFELGSDLVECLNDWLNSGSREWQKIRDGLHRHLSDTDEIEVIIETNDKRLRQLPWHLWDLFEHYPLAEVALSAPEYQLPKKLLAKNSNSKVRILAIFGNNQGIDVEQDRAFLEQLSAQAEIEFLVEPQREVLNDQLWEKGWDILFFAGHSSSEEKGQILLNQTDAIALDQLRYALKKAIAHGLRLAIFNSCDGLGLGQQLFDLHIGQVIVMREPVPDVVAQAFLGYFLTAFSSGKSLYAAVREARERLQKLEGQYPYATWLPVICQNPAEVPPTWHELCGVPKRDSATGIAEQQNRQILPKRRIQTVLVASVVVTSLVMGMRSLGLLQSWELKAFDQLMRLRPDEAPDKRLLIVEVTKEDIEQLGDKYPLSDLITRNCSQQKPGLVENPVSHKHSSPGVGIRQRETKQLTPAIALFVQLRVYINGHDQDSLTSCLTKDCRHRNVGDDGNGTVGGRMACQAATTTQTAATFSGRKTAPNRGAAKANRGIERAVGQAQKPFLPEQFCPTFKRSTQETQRQKQAKKR
jgi:hypothetical protein